DFKPIVRKSCIKPCSENVVLKGVGESNRERPLPGQEHGGPKSEEWEPTEPRDNRFDLSNDFEREESQNVPRLPLSVATSDVEWVVSQWSSCRLESDNKACGRNSGIRTRNVTCERRDSPVVVSNSRCLLVEPMPQIRETCELLCRQDCVVSDYFNWTECSSTCMLANKTRTRVVIVPPRHRGSHCPELSDMVPCVNCTTSFIYQYMAWLPCTSMDNNYANGMSTHPLIGYQTREVACLQSKGVLASDRYCQERFPHTIPRKARACVMAQDCILSSWSPMTPHNSSCIGYDGVVQHGFMVRTRQVLQLPLGSGDPCPSELVDYIRLNKEDLKSLRSCKQTKWITSNWTPCESVPGYNHCGTGIQTRNAICVEPGDDGVERPVEEDHCMFQYKPSVAASCTIECNYDCSVSQWSAWSTCQDIECEISSIRQRRAEEIIGKRFRTRVILTLPGSGGKPCPHVSETRMCEPQPCFTWNITLGPCEATVRGGCGEGTQLRKAVCLNRLGAKVRERFCHENLQAEQNWANCYVPCPEDCIVSEWGSWSSCPNPCDIQLGGRVVRTRARQILSSQLQGRSCPYQSNLRQTEPCPVLQDCETYQWEVSSWGTCVLEQERSKCGRGTQTRNVDCFTARKVRAPSYKCLEKIQPVMTQTCVVPCPSDCELTEWSDWSTCGVTCLPLQARQIYPTQIRKRFILQQPLNSGVACPSDLVEEQSCLELPVCQSYYWEMSDWSDCILAPEFPRCGHGLRARHVNCKHANNQVINDAAISVCLENLGFLPDLTEKCHVPCESECQFENWIPWTQCDPRCERPRFRYRHIVGCNERKGCTQLTMRLNSNDLPRCTLQTMRLNSNDLPRCTLQTMKLNSNDLPRCTLQTMRLNSNDLPRCTLQTMKLNSNDLPRCTLQTMKLNSNDLPRCTLQTMKLNSNDLPRRTLQTMRLNSNDLPRRTLQTMRLNSNDLPRRTLQTMRLNSNDLPRRTLQTMRLNSNDLPRRTLQTMRLNSNDLPRRTLQTMRLNSNDLPRCTLQTMRLNSNDLPRRTLQTMRLNSNDLPRCTLQTMRLNSNDLPRRTLQTMRLNSNDLPRRTLQTMRLNSNDLPRCTLQTMRLNSNDLPRRTLQTMRLNSNDLPRCTLQTMKFNSNDLPRRDSKRLKECQDSAMEKELCVCSDHEAISMGAWSDCIIDPPTLRPSYIDAIYGRSNSSDLTALGSLNSCGTGKQYMTQYCQNPNLSDHTRCSGVNDNSYQLVPPQRQTTSGSPIARASSEPQEKACTIPCPVDCETTQWTSWSACSVYCGSGIQHRERRIMALPSNGGRKCPFMFGNDKESQTRVCTIDCSYKVWKADDWGPCFPNGTKTCGEGTHARQLRCVSVSTDGTETTVDNHYCGNDEEPGTIKPCSLPCAGDCVMSEWSDWTPCRQPCNGQQTQKRYRSVLRWPRDYDMMRYCTTQQDERTCERQVNCIEYSWELSDWTSCLVNEGRADCGVGHKERFAMCRNEAGAKVESYKCQQLFGPVTEPLSVSCEIPCDYDCLLSAWSDWTPCSVTCGLGVTLRKRTVLQNPMGNGRKCPEKNEQSKSCYSRGCYRWHVSEWSECSIEMNFCGMGVQERNVSCLSDYNRRVNTSMCSKDLEKLVTQTIRPCHVPCPGECFLSEWSSWSHCFISCEDFEQRFRQGVQARSRAILAHPMPSNPPCNTTMWEDRPCEASQCTLFKWSAGEWDVQTGRRRVVCERTYDGLQVEGEYVAR
ncbi:thrombospondin type-1 domain-containing protein 7A, partial [Biomphalaria glabrata]